MTRFQLPKLPFGEDALEPFMSRQTVRVHYYGHHKTYIDKMNELLAKIDKDQGSIERIIQHHEGPLYNNAAQAWNHTFFWYGLCPENRSEMPENSKDFSAAVEKSFGGWDEIQEKFSESAAKLFGSGYIWLTIDGQNRMDWLVTQNAGNPLTMDRVRPLWTCDLWEHAYYLDYQNGRATFVDKVWDYVNWDFVENNFLHEGVPNMTKFMTPSGKLEEVVGQHSNPLYE